jgi:hypothetical protein
MVPGCVDYRLQHPYSVRQRVLVRLSNTRGYYGRLLIKNNKDELRYKTDKSNKRIFS